MKPGMKKNHAPGSGSSLERCRGHCRQLRYGCTRSAGSARGVGTPVRGGLTYREAHLALELIAETDALLALEVVEVNPMLDCYNRTAELAVELIASALGKRIF